MGRSTYKHYIQRWIQFCAQQQRGSVEPTVNSLITFFNILFNEGKNYNTLCVARSAISALSLKSEVSIGSHQLVKRFLTGCFNIKPALPRYSITWDPHMVLNFLKGWSPVNTICTSIEYLLCLLVSGQRGQAIHVFDLRNMSWERDRVICRFGDPTKTSTLEHYSSLDFGI